MEYDWFWVILAVTVFAAVVIVPLELALDAYSRWREPRRKQRRQFIKPAESIVADTLRLEVEQNPTSQTSNH